MARFKLLLKASASMDTNKKKDRDEDTLIRLPKISRESLALDEQVEIYQDTNDALTRIDSSILLRIHQAFSKDISNTESPSEELEHVGFVTTNVLNKIMVNAKKGSDANLYITDKINDTVIGADPEFLLFDNDDKVVRANNILSYNGSLGSDGAMAEIRPIPAINPEDLVSNIRSILSDTSITGPISSYKWKAGCYHKDGARDYPIGGHIHIGNPIQVANMVPKDKEIFFAVFNKILDELLSLPMIKIDGAEEGCARRTKCTMGKYGFYGGWRPCNGRLEHRTLSGMWLMHPMMSTCVLGTAKAIIDEVFNLITETKFLADYIFPSNLDKGGLWLPEFKDWKKIPLAIDMKCTADSDYMINLLHTSNSNKISAKFIKTWYEKIQSLSTYNAYSKYIDGFFEMLKIKHSEYRKFSKNLQKNWIEGKKFIINF